jgi:predicted transcriptional regulator YheO
LLDFFNTFVDGAEAKGVCLSENFVEKPDDLLQSLVEKIKNQVESNRSIPVALKNKEIIAGLYEKGVFLLKDAVAKVAQQMDISKNTVYMHLRSINGDQKDAPKQNVEELGQ